MDAAVAAAARGVLVPVLGQLTPPFGPECIDAGGASVEADYTSAKAAIPAGPSRSSGIAVGEAAAAVIVALRAADGADTTLLDFDYPEGSGADRTPLATCSLTLPTGGCDSSSPVLRQFHSFSQGATENGLSRIYVGFHFRDAVETGIKQGHDIGNAAVSNSMQPT
jgi:hypothetical protein